MSTCVVTGGAGFLGSHLCEHLLGTGPPGDLRRQPRDRLAAEHRAHPRRALRVPQHRHHRAGRHPRAGRLRLPPRLAGEPDRLPAAAAAHAQGRLLRHPPHARPRQVQARALPDRLDQRGLRRPPGPPAARGLLGQRQPDRPARRLRRGEALRRGADHGLPPPAGRRHVDRADLQHLRAADARPRRPGDPDLPAPGAAGQADDRVRRRQPDAQLLLRRRPDPRHRRPRRVRRARAGQHRQPERVHAAGAGQGGDRGDRVALGDRLRAAAGRRPAAAPPRHLPRPRPARLGARGGAARGAADDDRASGVERLVGATD